MSILTPDELAVMRREIAEGEAEVTWDKPTINEVLQGLENDLVGMRGQLESRIETTARRRFSPEQKRKLRDAVTRRKVA